MGSKYYYSLSINFNSGDIKIGVDESSFSFYLGEIVKKKPSVVSEEDGKHIIVFAGAYPGIEIKYVLEPSKIKEYIVLTNKNCPSEIRIGLKLEKCSLFYDEKERVYKVIDPKYVEMFKFDTPHIIYEDHNMSSNLDNCLKYYVDVEKSEIVYQINKEVLKNKYPVKIDPSFVFNTSRLINSGAVFSSLNRSNEVYITGQTYEEDYVAEAIDSTVAFSSDDVVFEKDITLIIPYFYEYIDSVGINITDGRRSLNYKSTVSTNTIDSFTYGYVRLTLPYEDSVDYKSSDFYISIRAKLSQQVYGEFYLDFIRKITYIPNSGIKFSMSNDVRILSNSIGSDFFIGTPITFKPLEYSIIPYDFFDPEDADFEKLDNTETFKNQPKIVEGKSSIFGAYFDYDEGTIPVNSSKSISGSGYTVVGGNQKSFTNNLNIVLKSAINDRTNIQEESPIKRPYKYVHTDDYFFSLNSGDGAIKKENILINKNYFSLIPKVKSLLSFSGDKMRSVSDVTISEMQESDIGGYHTTIEFDDTDNVCRQSFSNSYPVTLEDESVESWSFKDVDDGYLGCKMVALIDGAFRRFNIIGGSKDKIVLEGKVADIVGKINKFVILAFAPKKLKIIYKSKEYDDFNFTLVPSSINSNGEIEFEKISLPIYSYAPSEIVSSFYNERTGFGGISKDVSISGRKQFSSQGDSSQNLDLNPFIVFDDGGFAFLTPKGESLTELFVPREYADRDLVVYAEAPEASSTVTPSIFLKNGSKVSSGTGITVESVGEDNLVFKISIDLSLFDFTHITFAYTVL